MADADRTRRVKDVGLKKTNSTETQHLQTGCFNALSTRRPQRDDVLRAAADCAAQQLAQPPLASIRHTAGLLQSGNNLRMIVEPVEWNSL